MRLKDATFQVSMVGVKDKEGAVMNTNTTPTKKMIIGSESETRRVCQGRRSYGGRANLWG
jgi:hypothetical protein